MEKLLSLHWRNRGRSPALALSLASRSEAEALCPVFELPLASSPEAKALPRRNQALAVCLGGGQQTTGEEGHRGVLQEEVKALPQRDRASEVYWGGDS